VTLAFIKAGYNVCFEPIEATRASASRRSAGAGRRQVSCLIVLKIVTMFSPLRVFLPISLAAFLIGAGYAAWTIATQSTSRIPRCC